VAVTEIRANEDGVSVLQRELGNAPEGREGFELSSLRKLLIALEWRIYSAGHRGRCSLNDEIRTSYFFLYSRQLTSSVDGNKSRLARPEGKSSNSLVEVLVSWDQLLEAA
jgi:hypothetical protein